MWFVPEKSEGLGFPYLRVKTKKIFVRMKIFSGFQFETSIVINQINLFDYSSMRSCINGCCFHGFGGKLPTSLLNQCNKII